MKKDAQIYLIQGSRHKIYLIGVFASLILMFFSVWRVGPVIVEAKDTFGLASHLPPGYWMGLALLLATSIFAFLDRELKKDAIFITILIALGLFLLGIRVFVEANALDPDSYYPTAVVKNLLAAGHLDLSNPPALASYYSWPAIHFISASLLEVTGAHLIPIMKYTPLFWILCFVFITYGIGKRFRLTPNRCFLLCFLIISSWFISFAGFYYPRFPAMVLLLLLLMLLVVPRRNIAENVAVMLIFGALVLTHGLTAVAALPAVIVLSFYRRDYGFATLFVIIFGAWYVYQATTAFEAGIHAFTKPLADIFRLTQGETYQGAASTARLVSRYSELSYLVLYIALVIGSAVLLLRRKIREEHRKQVIALFCWTTGVAMIVFWGHGQAAFRTFIYIIVPTMCIVVLSLSGRKLMIALMCLFVALSPLANYADEAGWGQVTTSELKGAEFFALEVKPNPQNGFEDSYFYAYTSGLILYYDPDLVTVPAYVHPFPARSPAEVNLSIMDELHYIIISKLGSARFLFNWREDPYGAWPQTEVGKMASLLYDNGSFQVYENHL